MIKEQKIEWLANATDKEVVDQYERSSIRLGIMNERYGISSPEMMEESENAKLCRDELMRRLGGTK